MTQLRLRMLKLTPVQNKFIKHTAVIILLLGSLAVVMAVGFGSSGFVTKTGHYIEQKIPFSHETHAKQLGLDCKFCHTQVDQGNGAGMPTPQTCYGCHQDVLAKSNLLAGVRLAGQREEHLTWNRVNRVPDHVYFHHAKHIKAGVSCESCHGDVTNMPLVTKQQDFTMQMCLDCHRGQNNRLLQDCSTCHR